MGIIKKLITGGAVAQIKASNLILFAVRAPAYAPLKSPVILEAFIRVIEFQLSGIYTKSNLLLVFIPYGC